ncbi:hypothetical protein [Chromobacterium phragmitis]|uniref:Uncharacterized protein n=1 Tax=Chromobacterium phragmitis TaxID=2202141 RepID=A0ABV0J0F5_9NEIS
MHHLVVDGENVSFIADVLENGEVLSNSIVAGLRVIRFYNKEAGREMLAIQNPSSCEFLTVSLVEI